jgi:hypothetical protein
VLGQGRIVSGFHLHLFQKIFIRFRQTIASSSMMVNRILKYQKYLVFFSPHPAGVSGHFI